MFSWINKQGVGSSVGFEVQFTGRSTAEYREGRRYLVVDVEGAEGGMIHFSPRAFERWANDSVAIAPEERARLLKNFLAALEFQGLRGVP
jgi:hypothetical protein